MADNPWIRNGVFVAGLIAVGLVVVAFLPMFESGRGLTGPLILQAQSPVAATIALCVILICASAVAVFVSRIINTCVGLWVMGGGLFVLSYRSGSLEESIWAMSPAAIGIETLLLAGLAFAAVLSVFRFGGDLEDVEPDERDHTPHWLLSAAAMKSAAAGILVLPAIWFIGQPAAHGQMVAAVTIGGMLAGVAGRLLSPHVQPKLLFITPVVACGLASIIAAIRLSSPMVEMYIAGDLSSFLWLMPVDALAGSLMGVSMGYGWGKAFLHHEEAELAGNAE